MNRKGNETASPASKPVGRLEAHRWQHLVALSGDGMAFQAAGNTPNCCPVYALAGKDYTDPSGVGGNWQLMVFCKNLRLHQDGSSNHIRFGEIAACHTMNYTADATFANVSYSTEPENIGIHYYLGEWGNCPGVLGRHFKEPRAAYVSSPLPLGFRPGSHMDRDPQRSATAQNAWLDRPSRTT